MKLFLALVLSCPLVMSCASTTTPKPALTAHSKAASVAEETAASGALKGPIKIQSKRPADIVNILTVTTAVDVAMAYASATNFTGAKVAGYQANQCYLQQNAAEAVAQVAKRAALLGYKLQLLDCYRPHRASTQFMQWVADTADLSSKTKYYPNLQKTELTPGYIAAHSGHSRASTVDLTLLGKNAAGQWQALDMGGSYDLFDTISTVDSPAIGPEQKANRLLLKDLMQQQGFAPYALEWWHFSLSNERYPSTYFDFPVH